VVLIADALIARGDDHGAVSAARDAAHTAERTRGFASICAA